MEDMGGFFGVEVAERAMGFLLVLLVAELGRYSYASGSEFPSPSL